MRVARDEQRRAHRGFGERDGGRRDGLRAGVPERVRRRSHVVRRAGARGGGGGSPSLAGEGAVADYLDALTVASDVLVRHERGGAFQRRILFVTDLRTPCAVDEDFLDGMAAGMRGASVQLVVAVASSSGDDDAVRANRAMLERLCARLNAPGADGSIVPAARRSEVSAARGALLAAQVKQIKPTTTFRGDPHPPPG